MILFEDLKKNIFQQTTLLCEEMNLDLIDLVMKGNSQSMSIQVFVDLPLGGIGFQECSKLNRRLDDILYHECHLGEHYTLEVSSPGLDRWLVGYRDLRRVIGRSLQVILKDKMHEKKEVSGILKAVREEEIILEVKKEEWVIPIPMIEKSKQIIP